MPQTLAEQLKAIPMSSTLRETLDRARGFARAQSHRAVLLEHLLLALIEDPDASGVLRASQVDADQLGTEASGYLGLRDDMRAEPGHEPQPDAELQRVLHAAGQAAQQSRRRQIDGAIVLAAIVGDGKSPAAGMLKTLGLGFDEAIRALQKASAQARSKQFAPSPPTSARPAPVATPAPEPSPLPVAPAAPPPPAPMPETAAEAELQEPAEPPQTVEEILAAARARIQRRTAGIVGKPAMPAPAHAPVPAPEPATVSDEPETELTIPDPPAPQAMPPRAPQMSEGASWTPPATALPDPAPPPRPAAGFNKPPLSFPPRPFPPRESLPPAMRPPLPNRGPQLGAQPGLPGKTPGAPWPPAGRLPAQQWPPLNGAGGGGPAPLQAPQKPAAGRQGSAGPLVETIPRRMSVGAPAPAQVRINRDKIDALVQLLAGRREAPQRRDAFLMRALTVRLVAPDGGFWIETNAPETQWIDTSNANLQQDDHASWRWTVVPQARGRHRLLLSVSMRTVGPDGLAAETAPPDRVIDVAVKGGAGHGALRWLKVAALLVAGALIGRFGSELWAMGATAIRRFL